MRAHRREVDVTLFTPTPLSPEQLQLMQKSIQADYLAPQDNLIFTATLDASIKGGYKLLIKGQEHDLTWNKALDETKSAHRHARHTKLDSLLVRPPPRSSSLLLLLLLLLRSISLGAHAQGACSRAPASRRGAACRQGGCLLRHPVCCLARAGERPDRRQGAAGEAQHALGCSPE